MISKIVTIDKHFGPAVFSLIAVFEKFPNKSINGLLESTKKFSKTFEVILVTHQIEGEKNARQLLFEISNEKLNLVKMRLVLVDPESDKGPAYRRNLGAALADSSVLLFIDDDALIVDDITVLLNYLQTNRCQGIQPLIISQSNQEIVDSAGDFITRSGVLYFPYCRNAGLPVKDLPDKLTIEEVPSLRSAFMLVQRAQFLAVGGFDSNYFFNFEDVDVGWRMTWAGYKLFFVPQVKAYHKGSLTSTSVQSDRVKKLGLLNFHTANLKVSPYSSWLRIFIHFQRVVLKYEWTKAKQGKATYSTALKDLVIMDRLLLERLPQAILQKTILIKKFGNEGRQKFEDFAMGKRFRVNP